MFSFSYKILVTTVVNVVSQNLLTFIFGRLYTANAVGNFSQAFKWDTMASTMVSGTTSQVAQPILVEVKAERERQVLVFRKMLRFTAFLAFPAMFGLGMVAYEFIIVFITDKWIDSVPLLRILCISGAFLPFYTLYQNLMISRGKSDVYLWVTTSLIAVQLLLVLLCHSKGMVFMVSAYTVATGVLLVCLAILCASESLLHVSLHCWEVSGISHHLLALHCLTILLFIKGMLVIRQSGVF